MSSAKEYIKQLKSLMKAFADPLEDKEIIYHYTSAEGLRGIVESNEIWLTNTAFVNDTTECKALQKEEGLLSRDEFTNEYVEEQWEIFKKFPDKDNNTYIVSFCSSRAKDSLEQWRAYGNFCIGFEVEELAKSDFNLYKCIYSRSEIKKWILEKEKVNEWKGNCLDAQAKRMAAFSLFYAASKKYKNKSYQAEEEIRLIAISNPKWNFPNSPGMYEKDPPIHFRYHPAYRIPVPYVKFFVANEGEEDTQGKERRETAAQMKERKLEEEKNQKRDLLPIKEIIIGPMLHQEEAKVACEILLCEKGHENVKVNASDIPYRGF